ncbi:Crp/Fnr family transcriptional regulator [Sphingobacterium sp. Lzh-3]|uniref:Crp/Fnr family transcriptional regulator n=1 Tax=unclassified Sphingobacterium TaxID=2609468 RepID=UPI0029543FF4|nr:Crp/Fnr family transcriptional regulator [Sphingobacterium sp. UGAL515B_05]WON93986.1 Crp/Fnr family transcriptional regulator [Sphingobacterium sp. UGAL515B_05]
MDNLRNYIHALVDFSTDSWHLLQPTLTLRNFKKNDLLLEQGKVCNSLFFIDKGYCRSYYVIDGTVKNIGFFFENDIATNIQSFGSGKKSEFNIVACENLTAIIFDKTKLFELAMKVTEIERLGRHCIRQFASRQEEFANLFICYSAAERLSYLERKYPEILQRVPLSQLASFLGVARETLSRIRRRRLNS